MADNLTISHKIKAHFSHLRGRSGQALTLRQNFAWTFVGNLVFAAAQWGMLATIAKLGNPEMVGLFALGLAVTGPVIIFANLKLRAVQATDAQQEYTFGHYLALRLLALAFAFGGIVVFAVWSNDMGETAVVIMLVAVAKCFDALSDIMYGYLQLHERMDRVSLSRMVQGIGQLAALAVVLWLTSNLLWALLAWAIASGLVTAFVDMPNVRSVRNEVHRSGEVTGQALGLRPLWAWAKLRSLLWLSLPLGFATMLGSLWFNIPRYAIQYYEGAYQLGIFAAVASLMMVGSTVVAALGQSASPRLAKYHAQGQYRAFDQLISKLVILGMTLGTSGIAVAVLGGRTILTWLYTPEYAPYDYLLIWLLVVMFIQFSFVFLGTGLQAMREFRFFLPIQFCSVVLIAVFGIWLVPIFGLLGAIWSMLGANVFEFFAFASAFGYMRLKSRMVERVV